jgi:positive regulator of sigma E activity
MKQVTNQVVETMRTIENIFDLDTFSEMKMDQKIDLEIKESGIMMNSKIV